MSTLEERMIRRLGQRMREQAKRKGGMEGVAEKYGAWRIILSYTSASELEAFANDVRKRGGPPPGMTMGDTSKPRWHLSAQLIDGSRSVDHDWVVLGKLAFAVGAPEKPVVPIDSLPPSAVFHWDWPGE